MPKESLGTELKFRQQQVFTLLEPHAGRVLEINQLTNGTPGGCLKNVDSQLPLTCQII